MCKNPLTGSVTLKKVVDWNKGEWLRWFEVPNYYIVGGQVRYMDPYGPGITMDDVAMNGLRL